MEPTRILLAGMSRLMSDIIEHELAGQPDLLVVGVLETLDTLVADGRAARPDILVIGADGEGLPEQCGPLLADRPTMRVVGIGHDEGDAALYELRPRRVALGRVAPHDIALAIRAAAAGPPRLWDAG